MYAEDAIFVGVANFQRVLEGRPAIREYFAQVMKDFPSRTADPSNIRVRVYNEHTTPTVITTIDDHGSRTDASGRKLILNFRETLVWTKVQGKWFIVDHSASPLQEPNAVR
jgi:ketosteroid isomerase-like protein